MGVFIDLTGQRFDQLTAVRLLPSRHRKVFWECRCDCGKTVQVSSGSLKSGNTRSCGCLRHILGGNNPRFKDLTGKRFGKLTVIKPGHHDRWGGLFWNCRCDCGRVKDVLACSLNQGRSRSCGCSQPEAVSGVASPRWRGGIRITHGYRMIYVPTPSTFKTGITHAYPYLPEHVIIMSKHIGRPLLKEETVHHMNGNKLDNRIENLELWSHKHPQGQRTGDLLKYAREIITLYG